MWLISKIKPQVWELELLNPQIGQAGFLRLETLALKMRYWGSLQSPKPKLCLGKRSMRNTSNTREQGQKENGKQRFFFFFFNMIMLDNLFVNF